MALNCQLGSIDGGTSIATLEGEKNSVCVAKVCLCRNKECKFPLTPHLLVEISKVELRRENAFAISYTWGEFKRRRLAVGHRDDGMAVELELGKEWDIQHFIRKLAAISEEYGPFWLDQLCIPQKEVEIRTALASIPSVYRTLNVVVLMPGFHCSCLGKWMENLEKRCQHEQRICQTLSSSGESRNDESQYYNQMLSCLNSTGCSSWFSRIWTLQELTYSRSIRLVWISDGLTLRKELKCVRVDPRTAKFIGDPSGLTRYLAALFHTRNREAGRSQAVMEMKLVHANFHNLGMHAISEYAGIDDPDLGDLAFAHFLSGRVIESKLPDPTGQSEIEKLRIFLHHLGHVSRRDRRTATHQRDYVSSIWVDCPKYRLPALYKEMDLPQLVQDAVNQLHENFGLSIVTNAPSGLFGSSKRSAVWIPCQYLPELKVETCSDVYGALALPSKELIPSSGFVPLRFLGHHPEAKPRTLLHYQKWTRDKSMANIVVLMTETVKTWTADVLGRLYFTSGRSGHNVDGQGVLNNDVINPLRMQILFKVTAQPEEATWVPALKIWSDYRKVDHYRVVYRMVTDALGLDYECCQENRLELVVTTKNSRVVCVGIFQPNQVGKDENIMCETTNMTVCVSRPNGKSGGSFMEVQQIKDDHQPPTYRVIGVWVPCSQLASGCIGAVVEKGASDGFIV